MKTKIIFLIIAQVILIGVGCYLIQNDSIKTGLFVIITNIICGTIYARNLINS